MKNKIAWIGCLCIIGVITTEFGLIGVIPQIASYYNVEVETAGLLLSVFAIVVAVAGPFMTLAFSRYNRKNVLLLSMAMFLISGIVSSFSPPFWLLMLMRALPAFLHATLIATAVAAATAKAPRENAHKLMAIVIGGVAIANITTIPLTTYIAGIFENWQSSYITQTSISALVFIILLIAMPSMPVKNQSLNQSQLQILKKPVFLTSAILGFLMLAAVFATYGYFADYLGKVSRMALTDIGLMLFVFGVFGVLGNVIAGRFLGKSVTGTTAFFLTALTITALPLYFMDQLPVPPFVVVALWGFFHTPCFLTGQAYIIEAGPEAPEFANSISISLGNLGISLGSFTGGLVISGFGIQALPWAMMGFGILALLVMPLRSWLFHKSLTGQH